MCLRLIQPNGVGTQWQCLFASAWLLPLMIGGIDSVIVVISGESSPVAVVKLILDMTGTHGLEFRAAETKGARA